ncbi:hypothetical protein G6L16_008795 [Agrobacterium tumefaciens]|uniref:hypothetical protein n=1 Tax=Agrobacterium tumefaciens TaxID=358 RepID=UPI001571E9CA|nr:hypothetical protein [Agrobacterium tumefaciens]NSZ63435.1 hypothetical protein [Agrobacterium tumefaciens]NTA69805.1 hypothetical protein [Agrobacterium tumefaciens]WIE36951.1 hypothetical protein G6L16_008795 [Agrobacterium tumefaciens]
MRTYMIKRFAVCVHSYSLESGQVGADERQEYVSEHKSLAAACRRLGSLISGKRQRVGRVTRRGAKLRIWDDKTAEWLSLNAARARLTM